MKNIMIATTALTIGFGALTLPAAADQSYTGLNVWKQSESTFAPAGNSAANNDFAGARDNPEQRQMLHSRKDNFHKAW